MSFTILPSTDPVYKERSDDGSHVVQVFGSVEMARTADVNVDDGGGGDCDGDGDIAASSSNKTISSHRWTVGDLVVFTTDERGTKLPDPKNSATLVGHILALLVSRRAANPTGGGGMELDESWWAIVRHLLPWGAACQVLEAGERNQVQSHCRGKQEFGLLLTYETSAIPLSRIDPTISIQLSSPIAADNATNRSSDKKSHGFRLDIRKDCWVLDQVYGVRDRKDQLTLLAAANEWNNQGYKVNYSDVVPIPLLRGWKTCLRGMKGLRRGLESGLRTSLRALGHLHACPPSLVPPAPDDLETSDDEEPFTSLLELPSHPAQALSKKHPAQSRSGAKKHAKRKLSSSKPDRPKRLRKASSHEEIESPSRQDSSDSLSGEKDLKEQASGVGVQSLSPLAQNAAADVRPLSPPVFVLRTSRNVKVPHPLSFYTQVEVTTDALNARARRKRLTLERLRWTVSVGDVVIFASGGKVEPSTASANTSASSWSPFPVPCNVAQVLSIYQRHDNVEECSDAQDGAEDDQSKEVSAGGGTWWMELRWFYRPEELAALGKAPPDGCNSDFSLVEVDELVSTAPVYWVLGRARVTSSSHEKLGVSTDKDGVLNVTFLCQHIFMQRYDEDAVRPIRDWDIHVGGPLAGPLSRALLCEKAWPGSRRQGTRRLQTIYTKFLIQRFRLPDLKLESGVAFSAAAHDETPKSNPHHHSWPGGLLEDVDVLEDAQSQRILCRSRGREFLPSILIPTWLKRYDTRATATKSITLPPWKLAVGECVCLADVGSNHAPPRTKESKNPWYPFRGPWRPAQVLSIYREPGSENTSNIQLEIRSFLRPDELSSPLLSLLPHTFDDEVFESEIVERNIPVWRVLGHCEVGKPHIQQPTEVVITSQVPVIRRRNRYIFLWELQRFLPLFSGTNAGWKKSLIQRGLRCSNFIQNDASLANSVEFALDVKLNPQDGDMRGALFSVLPTDNARPHTLGANLYSTVLLSPQWESFHRHDLLCPQDERSGLKWVVRVGDLVAARAGNDQSSNWFPFLVAWKPCQVLSIWGDSSSNEPNKATVQWLPCLHRSNALPKMHEGSETSNWPEICVLDVESLLGPVSLRVHGTNSSFPVSGPAFLPPALIEFVSSSKRHFNETLGATFLKGLNVCPGYDDETRRQVVLLLGYEGLCTDQRESQQQSSIENTMSTTNTKRVQTVEPPIFFDAQSGTTFYWALNVTTRLDSLAQKPTKARRDEAPASWRTNLGDVVAIQSIARPGKKADMSPFTVPWRVAEVVTIFEQHCESDGADVSCDDSLRVEVRWFYRPQEVSGSRRSCPKISSHTKEIYESDSYEVVSASSLLCQVLLRDEGESPEPNIEPLEGTSTIQFTCGQFWSSRCKSLVPIGSLKARINRGRVHSRFFGKHDALKKACELLESTNSSGLPKSASFSVKDAFQRVIDKLSLTDASKEAMHDSIGIIGREAERSFISDFLLMAISGSKQDESKTSFSLFVAGPPGAGKTACVRACINDLRRTASSSKQHMADLDFIIINGMELRHPSDAYTRLWEEVSPDKERCQANTAGAKLEKYFAVAPSRGKDRGMGRNMGSGERGHVIVLLVDELDYLVTKKSGLVYELLFDWPSRSLHRRRLVVIGISNTINLLERLHERFESRIGCKTCFFESYKHEQIYRIVQAKVAQASPDYEVFDENAITFVSKKTAALSGDVRKAFRQCRAAAEMVLANLECGAEENQGASPRVSIKDVLQVDRDSFNSARTKSVTLCSPFEALFLVALASLCKWTGREHGSFDVEEILTKMNAMAKSLGDSRYLPPPTLDETLLLVSRLGEAHLIDLSTPRNSSASHRPGVSGSGGPWPFVKMVLDDTAILVALTKTDNRELAQKFLKQWPGSHTI